ncbi:hypothetical protein CW749_14725 [Vibrio sp. vnigr-6D03]|uniref:hypothetical protein n=1 Tax=Vibrio sp. vnigr-6D03 TaxID=2058088 RepID=UPI000C32A01A|nr:hypothetical protein [Vibrio sp. vnigr-6D03]PKF78787.1 hypothetical protein CW749_14725 [Vibrio sp. vnigr-6D03]
MSTRGLSDDELRRIYELQQSGILNANSSAVSLESSAVANAVATSGVAVDSSAVSDSILQSIEKIVVSEQSLKVASATENIRREIVGSSSHQEMLNVYDRLYEGGSINSFFNDQVGEINLHHQDSGTSLSIETVRNSYNENGVFADVIVSKFDVTTAGISANVFSETLTTGQGKFERISVFGEQGGLLSTQTFQLGANDVSLGEAGWSQFSQGDFLLNSAVNQGGSTDFDSILSDSFGGLNVSSSNPITGGTTYGMGSYDGVTNRHALEGIADSPFGMNAGGFGGNSIYSSGPGIASNTNFENNTPLVGVSSYSDQSPYPVAPDVSLSSLDFENTYGVGIGASNDGIGTTLKFDYNSTTENLSVQFSGGFSGELCVPIPQTPIPDKICISGEMKGDAKFNFGITGGNPTFNGAEGTVTGGAKMFYQAGEKGANVAAGVEVSFGAKNACNVEIKGEVFLEGTLGPVNIKKTGEIDKGTIDLSKNCEVKSNTNTTPPADTTPPEDTTPPDDTTPPATTTGGTSEDEDEDDKKPKKPEDTGCVAPDGGEPGVGTGGIFTGGGVDVPETPKFEPPREPSCGTPTGEFSGGSGTGGNDFGGTFGPSCGTIAPLPKPEKATNGINEGDGRPGCGSNGGVPTPNANRLSQAMSGFSSGGEVGSISGFGSGMSANQQLAGLAVSSRF